MKSMVSRRTFCATVLLTHSGCFGKSPVSDWEPSVETEYLQDRNSVRVWHTGDDPLSGVKGHDITIIRILVTPADSEANASGGRNNAILEKGENTVDDGVWTDKEGNNGISPYPLPPDDEVFVTAYDDGYDITSDLATGDKIVLRADYQGLDRYYPIGEIP